MLLQITLDMASRIIKRCYSSPAVHYLTQCRKISQEQYLCTSLLSRIQKNTVEYRRIQKTVFECIIIIQYCRMQ